MRGLAVVGLILVLLAAIPVSFSAPEKDRLRRAADSYFPLEVGNWWVYEGWMGPVSVLDRVTAANGLSYFVLDGYFGNSRRLRVSRSDVVSEFDAAGGEDFLWYMLGAPVGTTWQIRLSGRSFCISGVPVTLASRTDVVKVPAGEFRNVVRVEYGPVCCDCGISVEWFAPGVGLIRREQQSIEGIRVTQLVDAQVGGVLLRRPRYDASLSLDRPIYRYNLSLPLGPDSIPTVRAVFVLRNDTDNPLRLSFLGCKKVLLSVLNADGAEVAKGGGDDGSCTLSPTPVDFTLTGGSLAINGTVKLLTAQGVPLPDGRYTVVATLDTLDPVPLRPSVKTVIDVSTTQ